MTLCTTDTIDFSTCKSRKVQADFTGGEITSDAGVLLLSEADKRIKLTERIAKMIPDTRCKGKTRHSMRDLLRQRIYALGFVVRNIKGESQALYEKLYCARGEAENRIKEQQLALFSDRTSCMNWLPNQFRVLLSGLAYTLMIAIRRLALKGTSLARICCGTIRLKLFKIGAVLIRNTRRVRIHLSSAYPYEKLFRQAIGRLRES